MGVGWTVGLAIFGALVSIYREEIKRALSHTPRFYLPLYCVAWIGATGFGLALSTSFFLGSDTAPTRFEIALFIFSIGVDGWSPSAAIRSLNECFATERSQRKRA